MAKRKPTQKTVSKAVGLPALIAAHGRLRAAEKRVSEEREKRDMLIRELIAQGHSVRSIAAALDLARQSVMAIRDQGVDRSTPLGEPLFEEGEW